MPTILINTYPVIVQMNKSDSAAEEMFVLPIIFKINAINLPTFNGNFDMYFYLDKFINNNFKLTWPEVH